MKFAYSGFSGCSIASDQLLNTKYVDVEVMSALIEVTVQDVDQVVHALLVIVVAERVGSHSLRCWRCRRERTRTAALRPSSAKRAGRSAQRRKTV